MNRLYLAPTEISPEITLDPTEGKFEIKGKSIPRDGKEFYEPILKWVEEYALGPNLVTNFEFDLEFFNITSSKMLLFILYKLNDIRTAGNNVKITWYYRDEEDDMYEVGEDYAFMVDVPFEFLPISEKQTA
jgi:hypothetical protein